MNSYKQGNNFLSFMIRILKTPNRTSLSSLIWKFYIYCMAFIQVQKNLLYSSLSYWLISIYVYVFNKYNLAKIYVIKCV